MTKAKIFSLFVLLLSFVVAFFFYPIMPDKMASHWGINGEVDGYASKTMGLFIFPILMMICTILFFAIPKIDPEKENIKKIEKEFDSFIVIFNLFMIYLYGLTIFWNIGNAFNMTQAIMPAFALLFYFIGSLVGKVKRNYTIGIRLPWTIANETVWDKTHKLGEYLFKGVAVFTLLGAIFTDYAWALMFFPLIIAVLYLCFYSYREHKKKWIKGLLLP